MYVTSIFSSDAGMIASPSTRSHTVTFVAKSMIVMKSLDYNKLIGGGKNTKRKTANSHVDAHFVGSDRNSLHYDVPLEVRKTF